MSHPVRLRVYSVLFLLSCLVSGLNAQNADSLKFNDSVPLSSASIARKMRLQAGQEEKKSQDDYKQGQKSALQRKIMAEIEAKAQEAKFTMQNGIDTNLLKTGIIKIRGYLNMVGAGIESKKSIQTQRNLSVSSNILNEIYINLIKANTDLNNYSGSLISVKTQLDSLSSQHVLYDYPADSATMLKYITQSTLLRANVAPTLESLRKHINTMPELQSNLSVLLLATKMKIDDLEKFRTQNSSFSIKRELPDLWQKDTISLNLNDAWTTSKAKVALALRFYTRDNFNLIVMVLLAIAALTGLVYLLRNEVVPHHINAFNLKKTISLQHPFFTGAFVSINLLQFTFSETPFLFNAIVWSVSIVCISVIFYKHLSSYWMTFWFGNCFLFFSSCALNLMLESSYTERLAMLVLSVLGIAFSFYIFKTAKRSELKLPVVYHFSTFSGICQAIALVLNLFGRYNMAKTLLSFGFMGAIIGISLLWTLKILKELIAIARYAYKDTHRKNYQIEHAKLDLRLPFYIKVAAALGWAIIVGRNFYAFAEYAEPFDDFLEKQRIIGSYSFSIKGIAVFLLIMACSLALSKITSYFAADSQAQQQGNKKSKMAEIGSWILLVRIFIISTGIFLAFAAAGIPLDKLSIIIGALGVGIGLGLQGLVNNLVSGLIIAFEKPVNVGDMIEINQKMGTMRSIGFRSSVVSMADGASVVIPNGDLLGGQVTNWTMGKGHKRLSIMVGVAYGSDLERVKEILLNVTANDERVLNNPEPLVLTKEFNASSIDFELLFWAHIRDAGILRSDVVRKIDVAFKAADISIPFPQQDVYLHAVPGKSPGKEQQVSGKISATAEKAKKATPGKQPAHDSNAESGAAPEKQLPATEGRNLQKEDPGRTEGSHKGKSRNIKLRAKEDKAAEDPRPAAETPMNMEKTQTRAAKNRVIKLRRTDAHEGNDQLIDPDGDQNA